MNRNVKKESKIRFQERSPRHCAKQGAKGILQEELKASCKRNLKEPNKASCSRRSQRHPAKTRTFGAAVQHATFHTWQREQEKCSTVESASASLRLTMSIFCYQGCENATLPLMKQTISWWTSANIIEIVTQSQSFLPFQTPWAALIAVFKLLLNSTTLAPNPIFPLLSINAQLSKESQSNLLTTVQVPVRVGLRLRKREAATQRRVRQI